MSDTSAHVTSKQLCRVLLRKNPNRAPVGALYERPFFLESKKYVRSQTAPTVPSIVSHQPDRLESDDNKVGIVAAKAEKLELPGSKYV